MGDSVIKEVLNVIRSRQRAASNMDIKPSKRIYGTDMESPGSARGYLRNVVARMKGKVQNSASVPHPLNNSYSGEENSSISSNDKPSDKKRKNGTTTKSESAEPTMLTPKLSKSRDKNEHKSHAQGFHEGSQTLKPLDVDILRHEVPGYHLDDSLSSTPLDIPSAEKTPISSGSRRKKHRRPWRTMKAIPLALTACKLKRKLEEERAKQMDFLETIRVLRGVSKEEFYRDISDDSSEGEWSEAEFTPDPKQTEDHSVEKDKGIDASLCTGDNQQHKAVTEESTEDINSEQGMSIPDSERRSSQESKRMEEEEKVQNKQSDNTEITSLNQESSSGHHRTEQSPECVNQSNTNKEDRKQVKNCVLVQWKRRTIPGCRIDSRWPLGHPLYTRPDVKPHCKPHTDTYLQHLQNASKRRARPFHKISNKGRKSYEEWRKQLLHIAYEKDQDQIKGRSLRLFPVLLPEITPINGKH